jgi:alkylhydroperoxidase family enzyme
MTVRTAAVRSDVSEKEQAFLGETIDESKLTKREALAVRLADKIARDPHEVTTPFFNQLREHFTEQEIVELVFACGIFNWGNKFNITMQLDTAPESEYEHDLAYREVQ